jgi:hypothetical protein
MNRKSRRYFICLVGSWISVTPLMGCRGMQFARVIQPGGREMIGSHQAGQETFEPLIDEAVGKLLGRHEQPTHQLVSASAELLPPPQMRICFVGVENKTIEEIGDFKEQIYEMIDARLLDSSTFVPISQRFVDVGLRQTRLRPDDLFVPEHLRNFLGVMEQQGQPFDFLLFAKLTSGTTRQNHDYQRDYVLTLELVDIATGQQDKQSATLSKGYHHSRLSRATSSWWPWR